MLQLGGIVRSLQNIRPLCSTSASCLLQSKIAAVVPIQSCNYAAKRGTRERKAKICKKNRARNEAKKAAEALLRKKRQVEKMKITGAMRYNDTGKPDPEDNVFFGDMFKLREFSFSEAVAAHQETHHPSFLDMPSAPLNAFIELDLSTDKKTKFVEKFIGIVPIKHSYNHGENRTILAFTSKPADVIEALDAGATLAGGIDIIRSIKRGKTTLPDFEFVIAHPNILSELAAIRGLLRRNYPTLENGMLTGDLVQMIENIKTGIRYNLETSAAEPDYGWIEARIGNLDMEIEHLEENFELLLKNVKTRAPRRVKKPGPFITRCFLTSPPTTEKLKVPYEHYIYEDVEDIDSDDEDEGEVEDTKKKKRRKEAVPSLEQVIQQREQKEMEEQLEQQKKKDRELTSSD